jgi:four helix bundle protein
MSKELETRFLNFAKHTRNFCRQVPQDAINITYIRQLIRSSSSIGANYIEASDDLGKADEKIKIRISRREAKESIFWLDLILIENNNTLETTRKNLLDECDQIRKILSAILIKLN